MRSNVAIVIPVLNDADALASLLQRIAAWPLEPAEIVVAAAADHVVVRSLCTKFGCRLVCSSANRGAQLDLGARETTAPIIWFLHADADPSEMGLPAIAAAIASGTDGGCFRFVFQGPRTTMKRALEQLVDWRVACGGIAYGDQGLFARRSAYLAAGGFSHQALFEEVSLVRSLRRRGGFRVLDIPMRVATRRWDRDGWWRRTWHNRWLALCYACGVTSERLTRSYHGQGNPATKVDT